VTKRAIERYDGMEEHRCEPQPNQQRRNQKTRKKKKKKVMKRACSRSEPQEQKGKTSLRGRSDNGSNWWCLSYRGRLLNSSDRRRGGVFRLRRGLERGNWCRLLDLWRIILRLGGCRSGLFLGSGLEEITNTGRKAACNFFL